MNQLFYGDNLEMLQTQIGDRLRKEFEKWAILTYTDNQARINDKATSDQGIDGVAFISGGTTVFSVKAGNVSLKEIRGFQRVMEREQAVAGILLTLQPPTKPMIQEAASFGSIEDGPGLKMSRKIPRLQIVSIRELLDGARMNPPSAEIVVNPVKKHKQK